MSHTNIRLYCGEGITSHLEISHTAAFVNEVLPHEGLPTIPTLNPMTRLSFGIHSIAIPRDKRFTPVTEMRI